jgi:uncharacterized protein DUF6812
MVYHQEDLADLEDVEPAAKTRVEVWTDRFLIRAEAHVSAAIKGSRQRISDLLNDQAKAFLPLTNVTLYTTAKKKVWAGDFLAINKASIVLVKALNER